MRLEMYMGRPKHQTKIIGDTPGLAERKTLPIPSSQPGAERRALLPLRSIRGQQTGPSSLQLLTLLVSPRGWSEKEMDWGDGEIARPGDNRYQQDFSSSDGIYRDLSR